MIAPRRIVIFRGAGGYFIAGATNGVGRFFKYNAKDAAAADAFILEILNAVRDCKDTPRKWQRKPKPPRRADWKPKEESKEQQ